MPVKQLAQVTFQSVSLLLSDEKLAQWYLSTTREIQALGYYPETTSQYSFGVVSIRSKPHQGPLVGEV